MVYYVYKVTWNETPEEEVFETFQEAKEFVQQQWELEDPKYVTPFITEVELVEQEDGTSLPTDNDAVVWTYDSKDPEMQDFRQPKLFDVDGDGDFEVYDVFDDTEKEQEPDMGNVEDLYGGKNLFNYDEALSKLNEADENFGECQCCHEEFPKAELVEQDGRWLCKGCCAEPGVEESLEETVPEDLSDDRTPVQGNVFELDFPYDYKDEIAKEKLVDEDLEEETHNRFAKPEGDRKAAYNNAMQYANQYGVPFCYGYTNNRLGGKFFALEQPVKFDKDDSETKFRQQYKNCNVIYVAYPYMHEELEEDFNFDDFDLSDVKDVFSDPKTDPFSDQYDPDAALSEFSDAWKELESRSQQTKKELDDILAKYDEVMGTNSHIDIEKFDPYKPFAGVNESLTEDILTESKQGKISKYFDAKNVPVYKFYGYNEKGKLVPEVFKDKEAVNTFDAAKQVVNKITATGKSVCIVLAKEYTGLDADFKWLLFDGNSQKIKVDNSDKFMKVLKDFKKNDKANAKKALGMEMEDEQEEASAASDKQEPRQEHEQEQNLPEATPQELKAQIDEYEQMLNNLQAIMKKAQEKLKVATDAGDEKGAETAKAVIIKASYEYGVITKLQASLAAVLKAKAEVVKDEQEQEEKQKAQSSGTADENQPVEQQKEPEQDEEAVAEEKPVEVSEPKNAKLNRARERNNSIVNALKDAGLPVDDLFTTATNKKGKEYKKASEKLNALRKALFGEAYEEDEELNSLHEDLNQDLKKWNEYVKYLQNQISLEEKALEKAGENDLVKKAIQRRIDAYKQDLEDALPNIVKSTEVKDIELDIEEEPKEKPVEESKKPKKLKEGFNNEEFQRYLAAAKKLGLETTGDLMKFSEEHGGVKDQELLNVMEEEANKLNSEE